jgi:hypothetical protein
LPDAEDPLAGFDVFDPKTGEFKADADLPAPTAAELRGGDDVGAGDPPDPAAADGATEVDRRLARLKVPMPSGGSLRLWAPEEVELWTTTMERYVSDYGITAHNDLMHLTVLLTQQLAAFRATMLLAGMVPVIEQDGTPAGHYTAKKVSADDQARARKASQEAAKEIRSIEEMLGLDRKTREAGGQQTVANYVDGLKAAAREYGIHLSNRMQAYEEMAMDLRWRIRLLDQGDDEDRAHHDISETSIVAHARRVLADLEAKDQTWAKEKGKVFVGKVR